MPSVAHANETHGVVINTAPQISQQWVMGVLVTEPEPTGLHSVLVRSPLLL
jgi:hypothetical protein